ncbi:ABC transporter, ATP-binding protein [invertebrate metagenome]|uniref:ABC transporter, ATP-binding protein n=1 Tax=invertebrate metagenome TaxID=1711999 RepID=A0A484H6J6_9ZZZZ
MSAMIVLDRLSKRFNQLIAVDGITLTVKRGEVLAFLGPNGAGKSTTMKMVTGFLTPTAGTAAVCGFDMTTQPLAAKAKLGYLPEGAPAYGDMTPAAFLSFIANVRGYSRVERGKRVAAVAKRVALTEVLYQPIDTLSKGFRRRVGLAQAILHNPEVLILDEPTDGLDPNQKHHVRTLIRDMAADKAIIVSTHILEEVEALCCRAVIIARGRLVADGTAEELLAHLPCHNAVTVTVAAAEATVVEQKLRRLVHACDVEHIKNENAPDESSRRLRVLPREGRALTAAVSEALRSHALIALTVERGRLDDVFRTLTLPG